jgi:hypothetical protein
MSRSTLTCPLCCRSLSACKCPVTRPSDPTSGSAWWERHHLMDVVESLHIVTGPNGMCMCGTDGMTCGQLLATLSSQIQDAQIQAKMVTP